MNGPFNAAYADTLLTESQGRTARTVAGHALDHLGEAAAKRRGRRLAIDKSKIEGLKEIAKKRAVASFYLKKDDMKTILTNFLTDAAVTTELANMKAGTKDTYKQEAFEHDPVDIVVLTDSPIFPLMSGTVKASFVLIQTTTDAPPNLHLQTMFPK